MNFTDFFDPLDINHLTAYQHLQKKGMWPEGFIPDNVQFESNWQLLLQSKMADLWVGTNIFMHKMKPDKNIDQVINMDRLFEIAEDFDRKRKKDG